jgi:hypothetical protein
VPGEQQAGDGRHRQQGYAPPSYRFAAEPHVSSPRASRAMACSAW